MLSLILVIAILFALYHIKKIVEFFKKLHSDSDRVVACIILCGCLAPIVMIYVSNISYITNYNSNVETLNYYQDILAQLRFQLDEVNENIEHFSEHPMLTNEEKSTILESLSIVKSDIEIKIDSLNKEVERLSYHCDFEVLKKFKFLIYFG